MCIMKISLCSDYRTSFLNLTPVVGASYHYIERRNYGIHQEFSSGKKAWKWDRSDPLWDRCAGYRGLVSVGDCDICWHTVPGSLNLKETWYNGLYLSQNCEKPLYMGGTQ